MKDSEIGHSDGEILIGSLEETEHHAMAGAVHGLETVLLVFALDPEDVLLVLEIVARDLPELRTIYIGTNNLIITSNFVFSSHKLLKSTINDRSVRIK